MSPLIIIKKNSNFFQDGVLSSSDYNHKSFTSVEIFKIIAVLHAFQMIEPVYLAVHVTRQLSGCQWLSMVSGKHQMQKQR